MAKSAQFDFEFVNVNLTPKEKEILKSQPFTLEDCDNSLLRLAESNYKVSVSYDSRNKCFSCFIAPTASSVDNKGLLLSAKGSTPIKAIKQAVWAHYVLWKEHWPTSEQRSVEIDD